MMELKHNLIENAIEKKIPRGRKSLGPIIHKVVTKWYTKLRKCYLKFQVNVKALNNNLPSSFASKYVLFRGVIGREKQLIWSNVITPKSAVSSLLECSARISGNALDSMRHIWFADCRHFWEDNIYMKQRFRKYRGKIICIFTIIQTFFSSSFNSNISWNWLKISTDGISFVLTFFPRKSTVDKRSL